MLELIALAGFATVEKVSLRRPKTEFAISRINCISDRPSNQPFVGRPIDTVMTEGKAWVDDWLMNSRNLDGHHFDMLTALVTGPGRPIWCVGYPSDRRDARQRTRAAGHGDWSLHRRYVLLTFERSSALDRSSGSALRAPISLNSASGRGLSIPSLLAAPVAGRSLLVAAHSRRLQSVRTECAAIHWW